MKNKLTLIFAISLSTITANAIVLEPIIIFNFFRAWPLFLAGILKIDNQVFPRLKRLLR